MISKKSRVSVLLLAGIFGAGLTFTSAAHAQFETDFQLNATIEVNNIFTVEQTAPLSMGRFAVMSAESGDPDCQAYIEIDQAGALDSGIEDAVSCGGDEAQLFIFDNAERAEFEIRDAADTAVMLVEATPVSDMSCIGHITGCDADSPRFIIADLLHDDTVTINGNTTFYVGARIVTEYATNPVYLEGDYVGEYSVTVAY